MATVLPTSYRNHSFRSRLEARWAVFFDQLEIRWEYEPEGFQLSDGSCYLPDFWLPTFEGGIYAEVKPEGGDFSKARQLAMDTGRSVWLCEGVPDFRLWTVAAPDGSDWSGVPNTDEAFGEDRMYAEPGWDPATMADAELMSTFGPAYHDAIRAAQTFRFWNTTSSALR